MIAVTHRIEQKLWAVRDRQFHFLHLRTIRALSYHEKVPIPYYRDHMGEALSLLRRETGMAEPSLPPVFTKNQVDE